MGRIVSNCPKCFAKDPSIVMSSGGGRGEFAVYVGECKSCGYKLDFLGEGSESSAVTDWNRNAVKIVKIEKIENLGLTKRQVSIYKKRIEEEGY